jgi:hypothetical protein
MDLAADGWTWNEKIDAYVRIIDQDSRLRIEAALPVTGHMIIDPAHTTGDFLMAQIEQIVEVLGHQLDRTVVSPGFDWIDSAWHTPEQVGKLIADRVRTGQSFVYVAGGERSQTRYTTRRTRRDGQ